MPRQSIKLGKTDAAGYINEIRNRAGLPPYDGNDLWNEMKLQRRLKFAFECRASVISISIALGGSRRQNDY